MLLRLITQLLRQRSDATRAADDRVRTAAAEHAQPLGDRLRRGLEVESEGDFEAALEIYRGCVADHPEALNARLAATNALSTLWRTDEAIAEFEGAVACAPVTPEVFSSLLLMSHYATRPDPQRLAELHRQYGRLVAAQTPERHFAWSNSRDPERRLRVGYVSRNLSRHSVGYFFEPLLEQRDRERYTVFCYYTHPHADDATARMATLSDGWRHIDETESDARLADRIRSDAIDVLVDLGGHTKLNRLGVFARKPAPVQMTWLGYPNTTGLETVDYRITDAIADPAPRADALHTETLLRLDSPFLCYRPPDDAPAVASRADADTVVFGSFNTLVKLNPRTVRMWARILAAVPQARLLLKCRSLEHAQTAARVRAAFAAEGIAPERIDLRCWTEARTHHLQAYGEVDVALDTFPYNGTTTTCEALWMGVPVVTRAGDLHMSRVGATLLGAVDLQELIAADADEYVRIAVELARDCARRASLRTQMRARLQSSALLDHGSFAKRFEALLRDAWRAWCAGAGHERA